MELLEKQHIRISMTQTKNPLDNAIAERVNSIKKRIILIFFLYQIFEFENFFIIRKLKYRQYE